MTSLMDTETSLEDYLPPSPEVDAGQVAYGEFRLPFYVSAVVEMPGGNLLARESLQVQPALDDGCQPCRHRRPSRPLPRRRAVAAGKWIK